MNKRWQARCAGAGIGSWLLATSVGCVIVLTMAGCPRPYNPVIDPAAFVASVTNAYFPLVPGTVFVYESTTAEGLEQIEVTVTEDTKEILGVTCTVVRDTVTLDGELVEDTFDWYAQDETGNVWYFGEDSKSYEGGVLVSTEGSWEAGVDDAKPGIVMEADPQVGDTYRQEYLRGVAEDMAKVVDLNETVVVPYGSFEDCLKTKDYTPLEPDVIEYKFYAPGVGQVLTLEGESRVELVSVS